MQSAVGRVQPGVEREHATERDGLWARRALHLDLGKLFDRGLIPRDQFETQAATASALEATLAADLSQVENARLNLQYATIKAPISGRTGALAVHEGDLIRANDTAPLIVINQVAPIYVAFAVPGYAGSE